MTNADTAQVVMQSNGFEIRLVMSASGLELTTRPLGTTGPSVAAVDTEDSVSTDMSPQETALTADDSYVWDPSQGDLDNHGGWNVADGGEPVGAEPVADDDYGYDDMNGSQSYGRSNSASMVSAGAS